MIAPSGCSVRLIDLPYKVGGIVAFDADGFASIYLNARWSREQQRKALRHEIRHINNDDIFNGKSIQEIEVEKGGAV